MLVNMFQINPGFEEGEIWGASPEFLGPAGVRNLIILLCLFCGKRGAVRRKRLTSLENSPHEQVKYKFRSCGSRGTKLEVGENDLIWRYKG